MFNFIYCVILWFFYIWMVHIHSYTHVLDTFTDNLSAITHIHFEHRIKIIWSNKWTVSIFKSSSNCMIHNVKRSIYIYIHYIVRWIRLLLMMKHNLAAELCSFVLLILSDFFCTFLWDFGSTWKSYINFQKIVREMIEHVPESHYRQNFVSCVCVTDQSFYPIAMFRHLIG